MEIYRVVNKVNGKSYIGKSINSEERFKQHLRESRSDRSQNRKLYIAIREFGEENFYYEVLEKSKDQDREKYWVAYYDGYNNGYNNTKDGKGNRDIDKNNNKVVVTSDMIDVAVKSYIKRPSIRVASKASGIPERRIRAILNENLPPVKEEKGLFEEDSIYMSIKEEIEIKQRELKNLRNRLYKRKKRIISLKDK